jgi:DNA-binding phage protein
MKRKTSISHDEAMVRRIRKDPDFATEYLKAALEDTDEPVCCLSLCVTLRRRAASPRSLRPPGLRGRVSIAHCQPVSNPRLSTLYAVAKAIGFKLTVEAA